MIVLDENIKDNVLVEAIRHWYPGRVSLVNELRPSSIIKDEAIPSLLLRVRQPTFVTINTDHYWRKVAAHIGYCIACVDHVPQLRQIPLLLRHLLQVRGLRTRAERMGKVIRVTRSVVQYYTVTDKTIRELARSRR